MTTTSYVLVISLFFLGLSIFLLMIYDDIMNLFKDIGYDIYANMSGKDYRSDLVTQSMDVFWKGVPIVMLIASIITAYIAVVRLRAEATIQGE